MTSANPTYRVPIAERFRATPSDRERLYELLPNTGVTTVEEDSDGVEMPCPAYLANNEAWDVIDAVLSGAIGLRAAGERYLPKEPKEDDKPYDRRLARSRFAPWYVRLRDAAVSQLLRKPIQIGEDVSPAISQHLQDIDLQGNDLNSMARKVLEEAIDHGGVAILVDSPVVEGSENKTLADLAPLQLRPYWVVLKAEEIIDAHYQQVGGVRMLTELRLKRMIERKTGLFKREIVRQIKYYFISQGRCAWRVWEEQKNEKGELIGYEVASSGTIDLPYIPIVPLTKFFATPPMLEIANLNLAHYQAWNRLCHALHVAANPRLMLFGYIQTPGQEMGGVDEALIFESPNSRAEWSVCSSINFEAQERDIRLIEELMKTLAISVMTGQKDVAESGLSKQMDRVHSDALLAVFAQALQDTIDSCLAIHCAYLGEKRVPTSQVNRSFQISRMDWNEVKTISEMQQLGQIPLRLLLQLLINGEWLPEETNIDELIEEIDNAPEDEELAPPQITPEVEPGGNQNGDPSGAGGSDAGIGKGSG